MVQAKMNRERFDILHLQKNLQKKNKPRIRIVKRTSNSRTSSKSVVNIKPTDFALEKKAFKLINQKRVKNGLKEVVWNDSIAKLAREHSENMGKYRFFSHVGLNGRMIDQRAIDLGINNWRAIGENIAFNMGFEKPAEFAVKRWMLSLTHRNNLLDERWTDSGIGLCITEDGKYLFTQVFFVK